MITINIAKDFAVRPLGRYHPKDGPNTGERFRRDFLVPNLKKSDQKILIDFGSLKMITSSFMEEAFGGLVREEAFPVDELLERIEFNCSDDFDEMYAEEIKGYIKDAADEKGKVS